MAADPVVTFDASPSNSLRHQDGIEIETRFDDEGIVSERLDVPYRSGPSFQDTSDRGTRHAV